MMPQPVSSDPLSDEPQRDREEREGDSSTLTTPASAPRDGDASQGLRAAAQGQQQQDVHNNNSFSLSKTPFRCAECPLRGAELCLFCRSEAARLSELGHC